MKRVVFRYKEEPCFGGPPRHSLRFIIGDIIREDIDIIQNDGSLEHGMRFENQESIVCEFGKVSEPDVIIERLEFIIKELKK